MRLFVAIQFTDKFKKALHDVMQKLKTEGVRGSFTPIERLHLTLCFIGDTTELNRIKAALHSVAFRPFSLNLSETGRFRDLLWIGTEDNPLLNQLVNQIRKALGDTGIRFDQKPFQTHITLVRRVHEEDFAKVKHVKIPLAEMQVTSFSLMNSSLINGKLTYTELLRISAKF